MRTLISTGRSSNRVFLFATSEVSLPLTKNHRGGGLAGIRCASLLSFKLVSRMFFPIVDAIRKNSLLDGLSFFKRRCFNSTPRIEYRLQIESTHALNSFVRSWMGIVRAP